MRIKLFFKDVDYLIASIKGLTVKNKGISALFGSVGTPQSVIPTRWGGWLTACDYYGRNYQTIKRIVCEQISGDGILVTRAKESINAPSIRNDLFTITSQYKILLDKLDVVMMENSTIKKCVQYNN
jgi:hypothetical protein